MDSTAQILRRQREQQRKRRQKGTRQTLASIDNKNGRRRRTTTRSSSSFGDQEDKPSPETQTITKGSSKRGSAKESEEFNPNSSKKFKPENGDKNVEEVTPTQIAKNTNPFFTLEQEQEAQQQQQQQQQAKNKEKGNKERKSSQASIGSNKMDTMETEMDDSEGNFMMTEHGHSQTHTTAPTSSTSSFSISSKKTSRNDSQASYSTSGEERSSITSRTSSTCSSSNSFALTKQNKGTHHVFGPPANSNEAPIYDWATSEGTETPSSDATHPAVVVAVTSANVSSSSTNDDDGDDADQDAHEEEEEEDTPRLAMPLRLFDGDELECETSTDEEIRLSTYVTNNHSSTRSQASAQSNKSNKSKRSHKHSSKSIISQSHAALPPVPSGDSEGVRTFLLTMGMSDDFTQELERSENAKKALDRLCKSYPEHMRIHCLYQHKSTEEGIKGLRAMQCVKESLAVEMQRDLEVSKVKLTFKWLEKIPNLHATTFYTFVMVQEGQRSISSPLLKHTASGVETTVDIPFPMSFNNVQPDFEVRVKVFQYAFVDEKAVESAKKVSTPKKIVKHLSRIRPLLISSSGYLAQLHGGNTASHDAMATPKEPEVFTVIKRFEEVAQCVITRSEVGICQPQVQVFKPGKHPVSNHITVTSTLTPVSLDRKEGWLSCQREAGSAWQRYYAVLERGELSLYSQGLQREIIDTISVYNTRIVALKRQECGRPHSYDIFASTGDRALRIAGDTKDDGKLWRHIIAETNRRLQAWG